MTRGEEHKELERVSGGRCRSASAVIVDNWMRNVVPASGINPLSLFGLRWQIENHGGVQQKVPNAANTDPQRRRLVRAMSYT